MKWPLNRPMPFIRIIGFGDLVVVTLCFRFRIAFRAMEDMWDFYPLWIHA